jgi:hypothetical protein
MFLTQCWTELGTKQKPKPKKTLKNYWLISTTKNNKRKKTKKKKKQNKKQTKQNPTYFEKYYTDIECIWTHFK